MSNKVSLRLKSHIYTDLTYIKEKTNVDISKLINYIIGDWISKNVDKLVEYGEDMEG